METGERRLERSSGVRFGSSFWPPAFCCTFRGHSYTLTADFELSAIPFFAVNLIVEHVSFLVCAFALPEG
jgi:hypothetical protein